MRRAMSQAIIMAAALVLMGSPAAAQGAKPLTKCAPDAVVAATVCMDKYEASVWRVSDPTGANKGLVKKIRQGKAKIVDLAKGGATQLGLGGSPDYAPCGAGGQNCANDIFAVSLPQVKPSAHASWFQAQAACRNSAKRLPSNAEWQAAVMGTPDPGPDNGTTDCNTTLQALTTPTGARSACVSVDGAFDMVGNLNEWTADWAPQSNVGCAGTWGVAASPTGDSQCYVGAATQGEPGGMLRGGDTQFDFGDNAGALSVRPRSLSIGEINLGFRCAR